MEEFMGEHGFKIGDCVRVESGHQVSQEGKVTGILPGGGRQFDMVSVQFE